jgi:hypothetical protein
LLLLPQAAIFALAGLTRIGAAALSSGGLTGNYGYDPSVYYAAADAFTFGRMPYRDFTLLHPPGLMVVLAPFAALGRVTTDSTGFVAGNIALALLGATNAVLVYLVARRMGLSYVAACVGGAFYAVWTGTVYAEVSIRLEPLGSFAFLLGMLALAGDRPQRARRDAFLAGLAFGFALSVKIWWIVPLVIAGLWLTRTAGGLRRAAAFLAGVLAAVVVVDGPFFVLAPTSMWHQVFLDQIGRPRIVSLVQRVISLSALHATVPSGSGSTATPAAIASAVLLVAVLGAAAGVRAARLVVVVGLAQLVVLLAAPSYWLFYLDFAAPALALAVAAAAHPARRRLRDVIGTGAVSALVVAAACATAIGALARPIDSIERFPTHQLAAALPNVRCVMSITPMALIELDALSRDLDNHCPLWVDATGRTYGVDALHGPHYVVRLHNEIWQADAERYLTSGGVFVLTADGSLNGRTLIRLRENTLLTEDGAVALYEVAPGAGS